MAIQPMALTVANPEINALSAFASGRQAADSARINQSNLDTAKLQQYQAGLQNVGALAFGVMDGKMDGTPDPARWEEALDMLAKSGQDVSMFRGRPDLAPVVAKASVDTLGQLNLAQNDRELDMRAQEFGLRVMEAAKGPAPTDDQREYDLAKKEGFAGTFMDYQQAVKKAGASSTTINMPGGGEEKFFEELDKADGKIFGDLLTQAPEIGRKAAQIDQLEGLLGNFESGGVAALQQLAGEWGIKTDGLDAIQAAQALINAIVPEQRQPGSGPMSDADLALFKQSIPRTINQPGGNQMIIDTMRGINDYTRQQSEVAGRLAARAITRDQARKELAALPNPLAGYADRVKPTGQDGGVPKPANKAEMDALPSGTLFIAPDGTTRRKP